MVALLGPLLSAAARHSELPDAVNLSREPYDMPDWQHPRVARNPGSHSIFYIDLQHPETSHLYLCENLVCTTGPQHVILLNARVKPPKHLMQSCETLLGSYTCLL